MGIPLQKTEKEIWRKIEPKSKKGNDRSYIPVGASGRPKPVGSGEGINTQVRFDDNTLRRSMFASDVSSLGIGGLDALSRLCLRFLRRNLTCRSSRSQ